MTPVPSARLAARLACALLALTLGGQSVGAQGNPQFIFSQVYTNLDFCGISYTYAFSSSSTCTLESATGTTFASSFNGELRARATMTGTGPNFFAASANVSTGFTETFSFNGVVPASLVFNYSWTGSPSFTRPEGDRGSYRTRGYLNSTVSIVNGVGGSIVLDDERYSGTPGEPADPPSVKTAPTGSITAQLLGSRVVNVNTWINVSATIYNYPSEPVMGTADADFTSTGRIAFIQAFDGSGADISRSVDVTTSSGVNYAFGEAPSAVVPEPASWALVSAGLLALGGLVRRRQRAV
ncbi:MAG: PEP-CTERM sorting domain-containing protein [Gemmatimonadota bacterium]|nr:PEP-CTERM sorting domain-containing protein [Gemmatimonadota bacterium]